MISFDSPLVLGRDDVGKIEMEGFWPIEDGFVWSTGKWCRITFPFTATRPTSRADLIIDLDVYHPEDKGQDIFVYLNGLRVGSKHVTGRTTAVQSFSAGILLEEDNVLVIDTPDVRAPSEFGDADERPLGAQLFSIAIRRS